MIFSRLKIFENAWINAFCDNLYRMVGRQNIWICGGVSRCLSGEKHEPKDIDFVTANEVVFNDIKLHIDSLYPDYEISKSDKRIIIRTPYVVVEIWNGKQIHYDSKNYYKGILPYVISTKYLNQ